MEGESRQVYHLAFSYPLFIFSSFSLLLSASRLVVTPFRAGSYQMISTRCAQYSAPRHRWVDHKGMASDVTQGMAAPDNSHISPPVTEAVDLFSRYDSLKDFIIAFPALAPSPQKHPLS